MGPKKTARLGVKLGLGDQLLRVWCWTDYADLSVNAVGGHYHVGLSRRSCHLVRASQARWASCADYGPHVEVPPDVERQLVFSDAMRELARRARQP